MRSYSLHRRSLALLAALLLVFTSLADALARSPANAGMLVDPVLGPLSLCTGGAATQPDGGEPVPGGGTDHCPLCILLAPPAVPRWQQDEALAFAPLSSPAPVACSSRTLADHLSLGGIRSRAPPSRV